MAYTRERFELAKQLFLSATTPCLNRNLIKYKEYSLRKSSGQAQPSTWIDEDDTSDYDPEKRPPKRKRPQRGDGAGSRPAKRVAKGSRGLVTLTLKSDAGKSLLGSLPIGEVGKRGSDEDEWKLYWEATPEILQAELGTPYALRKRERHSNGDTSSMTTKSVLSLDLGHPAARGCRSCWEFNHDCSLLERPLVYPCQICREDGMDCELFIEPKRKRACENCKRRSTSCSYSKGDGDHTQPCRRCQVLGIQCLAGPAKHQSATRCEPEATEEGITPRLPSRKSPRFHETIQPLPAPSEASGSKDKGKAPQETNGVIRTIRTSFAHPIDFAYEPPEDGRAPCNWCEHFAYGFMGLGPKTVDVVDYGDGKYNEMQGGHREDHPASRMCIACALERLHIMRCAGHRIIPLKGYDIKTFDFEAAYRTLMRVPGQVSTMINPWCSLCPSPAFHGCGTIQPRNKYLQRVDASSAEARGCGLLLCEQCAIQMQGCNGDLGLVAGKNRQCHSEVGSRADVDFLLAGSELDRQYSVLQQQ